MNAYDLAGLFDSRGKEAEISAAISALLLSKSPGNIKSIVVVLDQPQFLVEKACYFKNTARALSVLTRGDHNLLNSVYFVITKVDNAMAFSNVEAYRESFITRIINPLIEELAHARDPDNAALLSMLHAIRGMRHHLLVPNIQDVGQSRDLMVREISGLREVPSELFNFYDYDHVQSEFQQILLVLAKGFSEKYYKVEAEYPQYIEQLRALLIRQRKFIELSRTQMQGFMAEIEVQEKLDRIVTEWFKIEAWKRDPALLAAHQPEMVAILSETKLLLEDIRKAPSQEIPAQMAWLNTLLSQDVLERDVLLKSEISSRRWYLPWNIASEGKHAGPRVLLQGIIEKMQQSIFIAEQDYTRIFAKQAEYQQQIDKLKSELELLSNIYRIADKLIDCLGYKGEECSRFQEDYREYLAEVAEDPMQVPLLFSHHSQNGVSSAAASAHSTDEVHPSQKVRYK